MRIRYLILILLGMSLAGHGLAGCSRQSPAGDAGTYRDFTRVTPSMGTFIQMKVFCGDGQGDAGAIAGEALDLAGELEGRLSIFDAASEVNTLNVSRRAVVSEDLYALLERSKTASVLTDGEFDVTVAPILKKRGFYGQMPKDILDKIPEPSEGAGWDGIELSRTDAGGEANLADGVWLDLSGIAKGYIVDRMSRLLKDRGAAGFMVNAGGDIYCAAKPGGASWHIGLREPGDEDVLLVLALEDRAVATSGDYENWLVDVATGGEISHIVEPSTGKSLEKRLSSVTVIAPECALADALATGMMAMGRERALELAESLEGVEVITVTGEGEKTIVDFSSGAREYVVWER